MNIVDIYLKVRQHQYGLGDEMKSPENKEKLRSDLEEICCPDTDKIFDIIWDKRFPNHNEMCKDYINHYNIESAKHIFQFYKPLDNFW